MGYLAALGSKRAPGELESGAGLALATQEETSTIHVAAGSTSLRTERQLSKPSLGSR